MTVSIAADQGTLTIRAPGLRGDQVVSVLLEGRSLWSFRVGDADEVVTGGEELSIEWPSALAERLNGRATLALKIDGAVVGSREVVFGDSREALAIEDSAGKPLVVNKWGRLAPSFAGQDPRIVDELLDEAERLVEVVRELTGIELFVTGGTLLGPVRDGRVMPGDDDVDFAYLSPHENPSDVALEGFALERALVGGGYEVFRLSAGHLQIMFPGRSVTDRFYIDIFSYFVCNGWFYGTFHAREPARDVTLLPLRPVLVNGRLLPGPARPEELLAAVYGAGWRHPDPAFTFETPPAALRRYRGWLDDYNMDRENWEERHRSQIHGSPSGEPSDFAVITESLLGERSTVIELGCGLGADARYFAERGHSVLAVDYSRPALVHAAGASVDAAAPARFERINLNSPREAAGLLTERERAPGALQVYARSLFEALSPRTRDATLRILHHLLAGPDARAFVEFEPPSVDRGRRWTEYGEVDRPGFRRAAAKAGLTVSALITSPREPAHRHAAAREPGDHVVLRSELP